MKTKKRMSHLAAALLLCLLLMLFGVFAGCANEKEGLKEIIVGTWCGSDGIDNFIAFFDNGVGYNAGDLFTYEINGETMTMTVDEEWSATFTVEIVDKNHLIFNSEFGFPLALYRCDKAGRTIIGE